MTMTLAGRCDNQAIGGFRHIKWGMRGSFHGTHVALSCFSQLNTTGFAKERSSGQWGRRETGAMGGWKAFYY
jgi:hypothetical protein